MRGEWSLLAVGALVIIVFVSSLAAAQDGEASAHAQPSQTSPGEDIDLVFRIGSPDVAEVIVQERISCTVSFPDDRERTPCGQTGSLVEVRTSGDGGREYVFPYQAPDMRGTYEVAFRADQTARAPPTTYTATTSFLVQAAGASGGQNGPGTDDVPDPTAEDPTGEGGPDGEGTDDGTRATRDGGERLPVLGVETDEGRVMASSSMAATVAVTAFVANRWSLGGG